MAEEELDATRRSEELEALQAFYGEDVTVDESTESSSVRGQWKIRITSSVDLKITLPLDYPSKRPPTPQILAPKFVIDPGALRSLEAELLELYQEDTEVLILWAEHLRDTLGDSLAQNIDDEESTPDEQQKEDHEFEEGKAQNENQARVFHPHTSKYGQSIRNFDESIISDESNRRKIHHGQPYHPPKSGPAETMIAHVASVENMNQVQWVLAELLFNDKKVARATHNMIAYRFWDEERKCLVSDNDDDGEKGSGGKLAALLEMADVQNVIVVVSRWYGGVHLGPARFKYFASTARDALEEAGLLTSKK